MVARDCPMCGETMRLVEKQATDRVPGAPKPVVAKVREWVCPECDYFEDAEDSDN
jgi:C4-type Zn-finger protein